MYLGVELPLLNFIIFHKNSFSLVLPSLLTWDPHKTHGRMNLSPSNNLEPRQVDSLDSHPD